MSATGTGAQTMSFVENYETEQPILELARFMHMQMSGQPSDTSGGELYQVSLVPASADGSEPVPRTGLLFCAGVRPAAGNPAHLAVP